MILSFEKIKFSYSSLFYTRRASTSTGQKIKFIVTKFVNTSVPDRLKGVDPFSVVPTHVGLILDGPLVLQKCQSAPQTLTAKVTTISHNGANNELHNETRVNA